MLFVNRYSFHILDPDWGHVTIKSAGIPRFLPKSYKWARVFSLPGAQGGTGVW